MTPTQAFYRGWLRGVIGGEPIPVDSSDAGRAYRVGYEQGQRDRQDAEKLAKELYGGGE